MSGHRPADACRTLHAIGWQYAEPVLRSLVLALLDFKRDQKMNGYALDDQCYAQNLKRVAKSGRLTTDRRLGAERMATGWLRRRTSTVSP